LQGLAYSEQPGLAMVQNGMVCHLPTPGRPWRDLRTIAAREAVFAEWTTRD
jgi:hypothetical protein